MGGLADASAIHTECLKVTGNGFRTPRREGQVEIIPASLVCKGIDVNGEFRKLGQTLSQLTQLVLIARLKDHAFGAKINTQDKAPGDSSQLTHAMLF